MMFNIHTNFRALWIKTILSRVYTSLKVEERTSRTSQNSTRTTDDGHRGIPKVHPEQAQVS